MELNIANDMSDKEYKFFSLGGRKVQMLGLMDDDEMTIESAIYLGTYTGSLAEARRELQSRLQFADYSTDRTGTYSATYYLLCDSENTILDMTAAKNPNTATHDDTTAADITAIRETLNRLGYHKLTALTPEYIDVLNREYSFHMEEFMQEMGDLNRMLDHLIAPPSPSSTVNETNSPPSSAVEGLVTEPYSEENERLVMEQLLRFEKEANGTDKISDWAIGPQEYQERPEEDTSATMESIVGFPQPVDPVFTLQLHSTHADDIPALRRIIEAKLGTMKDNDCKCTNAVICQHDKYHLTIGTNDAISIEAITSVLNNEIAQRPIGYALSIAQPTADTNTIGYKEKKVGSGPYPEYTPAKMVALREAVRQDFSNFESENALLMVCIQAIRDANQFYTPFAMPDAKTLQKMVALAALQQPTKQSMEQGAVAREMAK